MTDPKTQPDLEVRVLLRRRAATTRGRPLFLLRRRTVDGLWELPGGPLPWGTHLTSACTRYLRQDHGINTDAHGPSEMLSLAPVQTLIGRGPDGATVEHTISLPFVVDTFDREPEILTGDFTEFGWFRVYDFPSLLTPTTTMVLDHLPANLA